LSLISNSSFSLSFKATTNSFTKTISFLFSPFVLSTISINSQFSSFTFFSTSFLEILIFLPSLSYKAKTSNVVLGYFTKLSPSFFLIILGLLLVSFINNNLFCGTISTKSFSLISEKSAGKILAISVSSGEASYT